MSVPVVIAPYDPAWSRLFEEERNRLNGVFSGTDATIEHVGSTAIPKMGAKPIIDMLLGAASLADVESRIKDLERIGYRYVPKHESVLPERRYFRKPQTGPSTHHLHCVSLGSAFWKRHLLFRDYLRKHPAAAADYLQLKHDLAERYRNDRPAYTNAKSSFIESIIEKAGGRL